MLEKAFYGGRKYWGLLGFLGLVILVGVIAYLVQLTRGLTVTGLSRDVPWGFYIAQFTFLVGVAASAVMVVLPYYLHSYKAFGRVVILGEFLAIPACLMCMLFIFVDMGQPMRVLNMLMHPTPNSVMFWDFMVVFGYLLLNLLIGWVTFGSERKGLPPPRWIKPVIILSIPWAVSIHTVTAFLYSGLEARSFWMTAILAPRFLASAFASGPSLLIILCLIVRKFTRFDPGKQAIGKLAQIVTYAMAINVFFVLVELFTAIYSDMPEHLHHFQYLFLGAHGKSALVPWMWTSQILALTVLVLLLFPKVRNREGVLFFLCLGVITAIWIEKGLGMVVTGFIPSPLGHYQEYSPTLPEGLITLGVYAIGFFILTVLYKVASSVREELEAK
jgi:molybdopterin-containing oxidoreductase family membrane subunit